MRGPFVLWGSHPQLSASAGRHRGRDGPKSTLPVKVSWVPLGFSSLELDRPVLRVDTFDALECLKEVQVSHRAAEFSVSDGVKARFLFLADKFGNSLILLDEFFTAELFCCKTARACFRCWGRRKPPTVSKV